MIHNRAERTVNENEIEQQLEIGPSLRKAGDSINGPISCCGLVIVNAFGRPLSLGFQSYFYFDCIDTDFRTGGGLSKEKAERCGHPDAASCRVLDQSSVVEWSQTIRVEYSPGYAKTIVFYSYSLTVYLVVNVASI